MLAQAPEGRAAPSCGLRDVRNLVPHDRVDHLEPLSRDGLQRLAVRHVSGAAARVVLAPSAIGSGEAVAREDEQVLQALVALARRRHRRYRRSRLAVARSEPAVRRQPVVAREVFDVYGDRQLRGCLRPCSRHRQQASVGFVALEQGGYGVVGGLYLGRVLGDPSRQKPHGSVLCGDLGRARPGGRLDGADERSDLGAPGAARDGAGPSAAGVGSQPRAAELGHGTQLGGVRQVGKSLELGAGFQQNAAQPVLVPHALADQKIPLRRDGPGRRDRGVGVGDRQQRVRDAERGLGDNHRVALVGLGVPAEELRGLVGGQARQVCRRHSRRPRAGECERADVADLVDDEGSGEFGEKGIELAFPVGYGLAREYLAVARRDARPVRRLPDVEPYDGSRPSRWCHGGILQSSGRSGALPATPTLPGRGARARQFPISRSERRAPSVATPPPGPSSGQGQTAIRRRPIGGPSGLARIVGNAPNARHRSLSAAYLEL